VILTWSANGVTYTASGTFTAIFKWSRMCNVATLVDHHSQLQLHQQKHVILTHGLTTEFLTLQAVRIIHFTMHRDVNTER